MFAWTLRITIFEYFGLGPQYVGLAVSTTCVVVLKLVSVNGPLPSEVALSADSALSADAALAASVPPAAWTFFASTMPRAGLVTIAGMAALGVELVRTTVLAFGAVAVMPLIRNDGFPVMFF